MPTGFSLARWSATTARLREFREMFDDAESCGDAFGQLAALSHLAHTLISTGDLETASSAATTARQQMSAHAVPSANGTPVAEIALARGELATARQYADEAVSLCSGVYRAMGLTARSRVAMAEDDWEAAERDAYAALTTATSVDAHVTTPDALECLVAATASGGSTKGLVRLLGAAATLRRRMGTVRYPVYQGAYAALEATLRNAVS